MWRHEAAVVSMDDIRNYFTGSGWHVEVSSPGLFEAVHEYVSVEIVPEGVQFAYRVEAADDPSDYDEGVTDEPVADIARFIGGDIPGGEFFERRAFSPDDMAALLRRMADRTGPGPIRHAWSGRSGGRQSCRGSAGSGRPCPHWSDGRGRAWRWTRSSP